MFSSSAVDGRDEEDAFLFSNDHPIIALGINPFCDIIWHRPRVVLFDCPHWTKTIGGEISRISFKLRKLAVEFSGTLRR